MMMIGGGLGNGWFGEAIEKGKRGFSTRHTRQLANQW